MECLCRPSNDTLAASITRRFAAGGVPPQSDRGMAAGITPSGDASPVRVDVGQQIHQAAGSLHSLSRRFLAVTRLDPLWLFPWRDQNVRCDDFECGTYLLGALRLPSPCLSPFDFLFLS